MDITTNIILKRKVFWSMLEHELPIPKESQEIYKAVTGGKLGVGKRHAIKLVIDGQFYDAFFRNEGFNRQSFDHGDIIYLTYASDVKHKLKETFS